MSRVLDKVQDVFGDDVTVVAVQDDSTGEQQIEVVAVRLPLRLGYAAARRVSGAIFGYYTHGTRER